MGTRTLTHTTTTTDTMGDSTTAARTITTSGDTLTCGDQGSSDRLAFLRLLQLASPTLPIGAFAYSQGLEPAIAAGLITDEPSACDWIMGLLLGSVTYVDLPILARIHRAFASGDTGAAERWNAVLLASRATAELQAEDRHLGSALARVLVTLGIADLAVGEKPGNTRPGARAFASMFALGTARFGIALPRALEAFAFNWAEAQTSAAVRLLPLGQSAGVRILASAARAIPSAVDLSLALGDDDIGAAAPVLALLSAAHETQYSRLFRS
jgi:urease accessory protein